MQKDRFIETYVASFLAARAERFYESASHIRGADYSWVRTQQVNDATELAEAAWHSLQKSVAPSTPATTGVVATVATEMVSTPTTSSTKDTVEETF